MIVYCNQYLIIRVDNIVCKNLSRCTLIGISVVTEKMSKINAFDISKYTTICKNLTSHSKF
jgi:hypothetical protein